jgi:cobalt-zinc-cadmium resistance protein CzcA
LEHLEQASRRLAVVFPNHIKSDPRHPHGGVSLGSPSLVDLFKCPLSLVGGMIVLWLRGLPLSVSAVIGFIALFWHRSAQQRRPSELYPPMGSTGLADNTR